MAEIEVNGVTLYYEEHGAGASIVCIHGTGSSGAMWGDAAVELARHGRTIVYDRRGCSRSERPEPYATNVSQHADDAAALIDALAAAPAIVLGRSYGGETAIDLALRYPDRVRALRDDRPHEPLVRKAPPGRERVRDVRLDRVALVDRGGDAPLGVPRVGFLHLALRDDEDAGRRGGLDRRPQGREPAPDDDDARFKRVPKLAGIERNQVAGGGEGV